MSIQATACLFGRQLERHLGPAEVRAIALYVQVRRQLADVIDLAFGPSVRVIGNGRSAPNISFSFGRNAGENSKLAVFFQILATLRSLPVAAAVPGWPA
jgi:hypothetical protein